MRRSCLVPLIVCLFVSSAAHAENGTFAGERADTVADGRVEVGVIEPSRWGVTRDLELYTHPLFALLVPHVGTRIAWSDGELWRISSRHELAYPSFGLGLVAGEGAGAFLPADQEIPQLLVLDSEVMMTMTTPIHRRFVTVAVGVEVASSFSGPEVVIEAPLFYPRTAVYTSGVVGHARFTFSGELPWRRFGFEATATGYFLPELRGFVAEQELWLRWGSEAWQLRAGLLNSTGWYPQGVSAHRYPLADFLFAF